MRLAIVEPYYGGSHRAWANGYRDHSAHEVVLFVHEARFWKWRMHGSYVTLADEFSRHVAEAGPFDVIVASDMLHLPAFLGAVGEAGTGAAVALYMHENQMTYPLSPRDSEDEAYAMINWGSMTVADAVYFNSQFHYDSWFDGIEALLRRFPDYKHGAALPAVRSKSSVMTVGVDLRRLDGAPRIDTTPPLVLWNQRWDFDKGPDEFAAAMASLAETHEFQVALAGEVIAEIPAFADLQRRIPERLSHVGYADARHYVDLLRTADVVVSTAHQEFFGVAITEAIYAGAFPVLPDALVYPERIPAQFHGRCLYSDGELLAKVAWALENPTRRPAVVDELRHEMARHDWAQVAPQYDEALTALAARTR